MRRKKNAPPLTPEEEYEQAASTAAAMLARRPLSEKLLLQKLKEKEFSEDSAQYAVERMRVLGALDDTTYAEMIVRSYRAKGCGKLRIRQELQHRGIPREIAQEVLEDFEPDWDAMVALLEKKLHGDVSDRTRNEKAFAALQRKGFSFSQIRQAMERYVELLDEEE
ncbi:MAG: regulatory protein RecX [Eubacteriales bacterium]|nr:regulatory protein RecX [Eubacteriales bacterium]